MVIMMITGTVNCRYVDHDDYRNSKPAGMVIMMITESVHQQQQPELLRGTN
jgi:hypothetical protein